MRTLGYYAGGTLEGCPTFYITAVKEDAHAIHRGLMTKYISEADIVMLQKVRQICKEAPKSGRAWTLNIAGETSKQFHRAAAQLRSFLQRWFPGLWLVSIEVTSHDQVMKVFSKKVTNDGVYNTK